MNINKERVYRTLIMSLLLFVTVSTLEAKKATRVQTVSTPIIQQVQATEELSIDDSVEVVRYIRSKGEEVKASNTDIKTMIRIAKCESGYNPKAKNKTSTATGIFQILVGTWDTFNCDGNRLDAKSNVDCAWRIQQKNGFRDWRADPKSEACWDK